MEYQVKYHVKYWVVSVLIVLVGLMIAAALLYSENVPWEYRSWCVLASIAAGTAGGSCAAVSRSGAPLHGILQGGWFIALLIVVGFFVEGLEVVSFDLGARISAALLGVFSGIFFGKRQYNRLKKSVKRKRKNTKYCGRSM